MYPYIQNFLKHAFVILLLAMSNVVLQGQDYYFFDQKDRHNIIRSANTERGKQILDSLDNIVKYRLSFPMDVPTLEGGHTHDYFCPIHNCRFDFDWNKPNAHHCKECGKDWSNIAKYNWAWVGMGHYDNQRFLKVCTYLYLATKNTKYAQFIKGLLLDYSSKYPTYISHNTKRIPLGRNSGKMFAQSLDEAVFVSDAAIAYSIAKDIMTADEQRQIEKGYLMNCAELLCNSKGGGNWQVWHNSGLIAIGVAMENDSLIDIALNDPRHGYHAMNKQNILDDGWWNEGSPTYHFYPLQAMLLSAEAARCRGINLYDDKLYRMFASPAQAAYPDLMLPSHNDGWYGQTLLGCADMYELAYLRFGKEDLLNTLKRIYAVIPRNSIESLMNDEEIVPDKKEHVRQSVNFPHIGFTALFSGNNSVYLKYGRHGGSHGHPDKLSIVIHDGQEEIVSDLGTTAYGVPDYKGWYKKTISHSTLSVDGEDQKSTTGKLVNFKADKNGGIAEAVSDKAYEGVIMHRKIDLKGNILKDTFKATSETEHLYDYVLILTKPPIFSIKGSPILLDNSAAYKKIVNAQVWNGKGMVSFQVGRHTVKLSLAGNKNFEIITGDAPGIPPTKYISETSDNKRIYPLIIRIKDKNLEIKTIWDLKN